MPLLQIRDVPDDDRRVLKARAAANGDSLNTYLLRLIKREVTRPTLEEVLDRAASRAERAETSALEAATAARLERESQSSARTSA
jgi:hypothetical protein